MSKDGSYRQILRSSSIIGGSSVVNILISLLRTKVAALLLGPAGVGLIGLFQNLINTASAVSSLGFGTVGTRQIAEAAGRGDGFAIAAARRALLWGTLILALVGGSIFWLLRAQLAEYILASPGRAADVGWLAVGVVLTVAAGSQRALLNGLRRIGDIARVSVLSAVLSTVLGVGALWLWGTRGLLVFVIATPLASFLIGHAYVSRLPKVQAPRTPLPELLIQWRSLVRLGAAFMVAGVVVTIGQLLVRTMVQRKLGTAALGQFQAAWVISMTYIGFVLAAMGTDYYPRLTAAIHDHSAVNRMVNEQTEVALLLAGPVLLGMLALAPWVIELLYTSQFAESAQILRWQVLGDVLKVASWPMGFIILAAGDGRTFMLAESLVISVFAALVWVGLPLLGVQVTGLAFIGMYAVYLPVIHWFARRKTGFAWNSHVRYHLTALFLTAVSLSLLATWSMWAGLCIGLPAAVVFAIYSFGRLGHMTNLGGRLGRLASASSAVWVKLPGRRSRARLRDDIHKTDRE